MATEKTLARMMALLTSAYPRFEIKPETPDVYRMCLRDLSDDALLAATADCISKSEFFPTIAEIRRATFELTQPRELGSEEAWGFLQAQMRRGKPEVEPKLPVLVKRALDAIGGWRTAWLAEDDTANRSHFVKAYSKCLERRQEDTQMLPGVRVVAAKLMIEAGNGR